MKKIWYIKINEKKEGPFSIYDLKRDQRITPDVLVWREGFSVWKKIRQVPELKAVFEDERVQEKVDNDLKNSIKVTPQDEIILDLRKDPPYIFWALIVILLLLYVTTQVFWAR